MARTLYTITLAVVLLIPSSACEVDRTQEARAPDVDVNVDPGRWPQYDVKWADVDVGMKERTITVPTVSIVQQERQVSVPFIDIDPPGDGQREERTIAMSVDVPHAGYSLAITEVRAARDDLWVIARLTKSDAAAAQVLTRVSDQVVVNAPGDLDVRKVVVGERPPGTSIQEYRFVPSMTALEKEIPSRARVLYRR